MENEAFYDIWETFKDLLRKYPYRGIQPCEQIQTSYTGLMSQTKFIVEAVARGFIMTKTYELAYELIKKLDSNYHQMVYDRIIRKFTPGILQSDALSAIICTNFNLSK